MNQSRAVALFVLGVLAATACSGSDGGEVDDAVDTSATSSTVAAIATDPPDADPPANDPVPTIPSVSGPPASDPPAEENPVIDPDRIIDAAELVSLLASDDFDGRDNQTDGSAAARDLLVSLLSDVAAPAVPDQEGGLGFLHEYDVGTNIVGIVPGRGAIANEYVMIGAHYDHLAPGECDVRDQADDVICNGAADNAAGVASVMTIVGRVRSDVDGEADESDRRGLIVVFWDGEEDGLVGSQRYVDDPVVPLDQTVAYVNFDIQGASLLPSMSNSTVLVGPETGGPVLVEAAAHATDASTLDYATLSLVFGQGRSDHAVLVAGGVPSVFFTDANNGCYHTVLDDADHYEPGKHALQIDTAEALVRDLSTASDRPTFVADAPLTTYADAVQILALVHSGGGDLHLLPDGGWRPSNSSTPSMESSAPEPMPTTPQPLLSCSVVRLNSSAISPRASAASPTRLSRAVRPADGR